MFQERQIYIDRVRRATSEPGNYHFTFDFSQSVSIPHMSRQMGPLYFLSLMKVNLFGFRISGGSQLNFIFDETQTIGEDGKHAQGPNAVISMLDWALRTHSPLGSSIAIHADNCPGIVHVIWLLRTMATIVR